RTTRQVIFNKELREPSYNGPKLEAGERMLGDWGEESTFCDLPIWGSAPPVKVSFLPTELEELEEVEETVGDADDEEYVDLPDS
ncbi:hypothetical protein QBC32DRAFT_180226, partial [Pseudoneurospora amorphoporcata]